MGLSIYYTAQRARSLTPNEQAAIGKVVDQYSVADWESFCVYDRTEPGVIFDGSAGLPRDSEDACWAAVRHWCAALTEIRRLLPDAAWEVYVDDHPITWDEVRQEYDPSR
jgi:hypothetical protein